MFEKINKKRITAGKTPILSEKGTVKTKIITDKRFQDQLRVEIEGCQLLCTITHSPATPYTDKVTGEEKDGFPQANIGKIAAPGTKQESATKKSSDGNADGDDWDDNEGM